MNKSGKYFDMIAHVYDQATSDPGSWTPPDVVFDAVKKYITNDSNILDVGIGTGRSIDKIYKNGVFGGIHGVDTSEKMIELCRSKYPKITLSQIISISEISRIKNNFDVVICSGTIEFIEDLGKFFNHIRKTQQLNGVFVFTYEPVIRFHTYQDEIKSLTVPNEESDLFIKDFYTYRHHPYDIETMVRENGYSIITDIEFISYKKGDCDIVYHSIVAVAV